jgi:hypothetical protein
LPFIPLPKLLLRGPPHRLAQMRFAFTDGHRWETQSAVDGKPSDELLRKVPCLPRAFRRI